MSGRVVVAGYGVAGRSAVRALVARGDRVLLTTDQPVTLEAGGDSVDVVGPLDRVPDDVDAVVASPGYRPTHPLLADAVARDVPVWGELELAWRLRDEGGSAPWLALTGTNGKTTTVHMLESILRTAGLNALAVGNVGVPVIDAVRDPDVDVLAVEVSSQQLHFAPSLHPAVGAVLNLAPDHLDWHGSFQAYTEAKFRLWNADVAIGNLDDPLVADAMAEGAVGFTLGEPGDGHLGVLDGQLVSRAFGDDRAVLAVVDAIRPAGAHNVANALAAAALARAHGVDPAIVGQGLRRFVPDPHRNEPVLVHDGVQWVDDSKATNPHAASASLTSYPRIVWVAGGRLKGVDVDPLVEAVADRLAGAVLLGEDRALIAASLARHAPEIPVIVVDSTDDGAMTEVVRAAAGLAGAGDTVLLAPAGASYDMFADYGARGDAFAAAARGLAR